MRHFPLVLTGSSVSILLGGNAFGAAVLSAKLDAAKENILIETQYAGGCGEHNFSLKMKGCFEIFPVSCQAELIEETTDFCEALIHSTVVISLKEYGLKDSYFQKGSLVISGDKYLGDAEPTQVTVQLP